MSKPVCDVCGINDSTVFIKRPEGTFCPSCNEKIEQIIGSTVILPLMKKILIDDLKRSGPGSYLPGTFEAL